MDQIKIDHINIYLTSIGLPQSIKLKPSIESLYLLTNKHFIYLPYQNYELHFKDNNPISLKFSDIVNRLCLKKMGGLCYEHTLLIYAVLKHYGFNVNILQCQVREKAQEYNPDQISAHAFLHIAIEDDQYIIDPGFGTRSLRYPLQFNIQNLPQEQALFPQEQYKLTETEKNYQLNHFIDGQWVTYYDFDKPLRFGTPDDVEKDYHQIFNSNQYLSVRDNRFMVCKNTEHGRIQYFWFREEKNFTSFKKEFKYDQVEKIMFNNYQELQEDVLKVVQLVLPNKELLKE